MENKILVTTFPFKDIFAEELGYSVMADSWLLMVQTIPRVTVQKTLEGDVAIYAQTRDDVDMILLTIYRSVFSLQKKLDKFPVRVSQWFDETKETARRMPSIKLNDELKKSMFEHINHKQSHTEFFKMRGGPFTEGE